VEVYAALGLSPTRGGDRDVNGTLDRFEEPPECRGGVVAEGCALSTREDRRHPAPVPARSAVADRVDAAVEAVELPLRDPRRGPATPQSRLFELSQRHDAVLA
jgi:hypothetical protein